MTYGIEICDFPSKFNIMTLILLQKKAVRCIAGLDFRESCKDAFKTLQILTVPHTIIYKVLVYIRLNSFFQTNHEVYLYNIWGRDNSYQQAQSKARSTHNPNLWNKLLKSLKELPVTKFK